MSTKMSEKEVKLVIGSLLHDIGKVIYRQGEDRRKHSQSGYDFLKDDAGIQDVEILNCVRYHHADSMKNAKLNEDSMAYITYIADNIASAADRREKEGEDYGFEIATPLESVFNILNNNQQQQYYSPQLLDPKLGINYPHTEKRLFDEHFYTTVKQNIYENLKNIQWKSEYINSLLEVLEANLTYVPSSTAKKELADISLYDHMKMTAAIASCIYQYLQANGRNNYKEMLYTGANAFYKEKAFLLFSMDVSGIQDFIYTIASKNALKTLRARSFYLEIMMEHCIDLLLERLRLSRANLIYSGGGHCYILVPNTQTTKDIIDAYLEEINQWFLDYFQISLYIAGGYAECSSETLCNEPEGSYSEMFRTASEQISAKKASRYSAQQIINLNGMKYDDYTRECKVCKKIGHVDENGVCPICKGLENLSGKVLYDEFFTVICDEKEHGLPLPDGYYLVSDSKEKLIERMQNDDSYVRTYGKNTMYTGKHVATKLWVGNYTTEHNDFKSLAQQSEGISRIGVLRADVDNLGQTFVSGFESEHFGNKYVTLSRTATLSRQLSLFFKLYLNDILKQGTYKLTGKEAGGRNATVVYSGGDDLFIVGAWNEIIEIAIDIRQKFNKYTEGTLTLSAGIGIYQSGYPIRVIAREVADMEDSSKKNIGKNSVTILEDGEEHDVSDIGRLSDGTYSWDEFEKEVITEKYQLLLEFFATSEDRGKAFLYKLLELIRLQKKDKIYFARYVYLIARLEPKASAKEEQKENYRKFSTQMYHWIQSEKDCRQLKTAINLYAYMMRDREE